MATVQIDQRVAILIDGNNIERSIHSMLGTENSMLNFDVLIPRILDNRGLSRLIYFREGVGISTKLAERLHQHYHGSVVPCHKSADIPLSIKATQVASKVDTIIILSGDSDYVELVRHLKGEGVRVEIAAVEATTAKILRDEADYFFTITREDCYLAGNPGQKGRQLPVKSNAPQADSKAGSPQAKALPIAFGPQRPKTSPETQEPPRKEAKPANKTAGKSRKSPAQSREKGNQQELSNTSAKGPQNAPPNQKTAASNSKPADSPTKARSNPRRKKAPAKPAPDSGK
ncbi:MAG: NYN domain-containing protein [Bacteroidia bacterium]|nr:NYN domain-containing protein [Bacteroidia bacterium]